MCDCGPTIFSGLVLARAFHFGACLTLLGLCAFEIFIAGAAIDQNRIGSREFLRRGPALLMSVTLVLTLVSGAAWLVALAEDISGLTAQEALRTGDVAKVWGQMHFGQLWHLRGAFWIASSIAVGLLLFLRRPSPLRSVMSWVALLCGAALTASLAWAGHGLDTMEGMSVSPALHLGADVLHLLVGGFWPAGLLPFGLLMFQLRRSARIDKWAALARLTRRFSAVSLASVALLTATGLVNSWCLVGSVSSLWRTNYGKALLVKLAFFLLMVGIGAINLLYLKPRLSLPAGKAAPAGTTLESTAARLRWNVIAELVLGTAIVFVVAVLGVLPPAME